MTVEARGFQAHFPSLGAFCNPVLKCVLDEGLQKKAGHPRLQKFVWDIRIHLEAVGEAHFLDSEILVEQFEFLAQRDLLLAGILKNVTQKIAQPSDHIYGVVVSLFADQPSNGIQSIKKKVRLKLMP
jgi:hypothetical protein